MSRSFGGAWIETIADMSLICLLMSRSFGGAWIETESAHFR